MRIFLTGGSGFVGNRLIPRLLENGHNVTALSRSNQSDETLRQLGATPLRGSLDDVANWQNALAGHDVLVHAAAPVTAWGDKHILQRQIVDATLLLADACAVHGVQRMVHLSSESVLQGAGPLLDIDETHPYPSRPNSRYGACKKAAELGLLGRSGGPEVIILRPSFIWGPGGQIEQVLDKVRGGQFIWVDHGRAPMETSHVDNVIQGILLALAGGTASGVYFITDAAGLTVRTVLSGLIKANGLPPPTRSLPLWLVRPLASLVETIWATLRLRSTPPLSRFQLDFVALPRRYSIKRAGAELGYSPVTSFEDGLAEIKELSPIGVKKS